MMYFLHTPKSAQPNVKPHIYFYDGCWRVTHWNRKGNDWLTWHTAHVYVTNLNWRNSYKVRT